MVDSTKQETFMTELFRQRVQNQRSLVRHLFKYNILCQTYLSKILQSAVNHFFI
jgi:hypothetical protein